jgi:tetratricopeptide (TPR) repeat protein
MHSRALLAISVLSLALLAPQAQAEGDELQNISQLLSRKQHAKAASDLERYMAAHPNDVHGRFLQGVILSEQKKTAEAIRIFNDLILQHPSWPEPYNNLAVLYAGQGQYERARQTLELALRTHPSYAAIHDNLSGIYAAMASEAYGKALQTDRAAPQPRLAMVNLPYAEKRALALAANTPDKPMPIKTVTAAPVAKSTPVPVMAATVSTIKSTAAIRTVALPATPVPEPVDQAETSEVEKTVKEWAHAWAHQDVDKYLSYYAGNFKTPKGESRRAWEQTRRSRIGSPKSINIDITGIKSEINADHASVSFKQHYRADRIAKRTSKTLQLQKKGDRWLIVQELAS